MKILSLLSPFVLIVSFYLGLAVSNQGLMANYFALTDLLPALKGEGFLVLLGRGGLGLHPRVGSALGWVSSPLPLSPCGDSGLWFPCYASPNILKNTYTFINFFIPALKGEAFNCNIVYILL